VRPVYFGSRCSRAGSALEVLIVAARYTLDLGALLDAVVEGLRRLPETQPPKLPRMADFALWAMACETALRPAGTFWSAYCGNRDEAVGVINADRSPPPCTPSCDAYGVDGNRLGPGRPLAEAAGERVARSGRWPAG
jgi:hypothetical protein